MDVAAFVTRWTMPSILVIAGIGIIAVILLGIKRYTASEPLVAINAKARLYSVASGTIMTILFVVFLSAVIRGVSDLFFWPY